MACGTPYHIQLAGINKLGKRAPVGPCSVRHFRTKTEMHISGETIFSAEHFSYFDVFMAVQGIKTRHLRPNTSNGKSTFEWNETKYEAQLGLINGMTRRPHNHFRLRSETIPKRVRCYPYRIPIIFNTNFDRPFTIYLPIKTFQYDVYAAQKINYP